jgi:hypothetical protein
MNFVMKHGNYLVPERKVTVFISQPGRLMLNHEFTAVQNDGGR